LAAGVVVFGALSLVVFGYKAAGFGGNTAPPAGSDSAAGQALLTKHFPQSAANPTTLIFPVGAPGLPDPAPPGPATHQPQATGKFPQIAGPLNPGGPSLTPAQFTALHNQLGPARALPPVSPAGSTVPSGTYAAYRATSNFVSPDGRTVLYETGLKAGDPGT